MFNAIHELYSTRRAKGALSQRWQWSSTLPYAEVNEFILLISQADMQAGQNLLGQAMIEDLLELVKVKDFGNGRCCREIIVNTP